MPDNTSISQVVIHMYKMGTGDCFVLKFMKGDEVSFKMIIDCGCWTRAASEIKPFVKELTEDVDNHVDVLVVTHEHTDHVLGFQAGKALLTNGTFQADRIWMGWPENDEDEKVKQWKEDYGEKKLALALAARELSKTVNAKEFRNQFNGARHEPEILALRKRFSEVLTDFANLHADGEYKGSLKGMAVVKEEIADENISYFNPGDIIENLPGLEGVRIFVLGPPKLYEEVKQEHGGEGESFEHNEDLDDTDLFVRALAASVDRTFDPQLIPFEKSYISQDRSHRKSYESRQEAWRRIDYDWLFSSGNFALRMNSLTNNLSLVLAFEFVESGKVVLFPGDAEFGSWKSWHGIDWEPHVPGLTTEDLLNRVVFYKVAHHLSHNGTAKSIGLEMMTGSDLVAMATLDYNVISSGWKSTMPNRMIVKQLLEKTKGRTMIMNTDDMFYDLDDEIPIDEKIEEHRQQMNAAERQSFEQALNTDSEFFIAYTLTI
jgi:beta-lactamase superfamily II metal-dependent hydrolase